MKIIRKTNIILAVVAILMMVVFVSPEAVNAIDLKEECSCGEYATKIDPVPVESHTYELEDVTDHYVTIKNIIVNSEGEPIKFDWTSTLGICEVIVKGGTGGAANFYKYDPPLYGDTNLQTPTLQGISHITFCYSECPLPECSITGDTEICDGETTELCANYIEGATYSCTYRTYRCNNTYRFWINSNFHFTVCWVTTIICYS